MGLILLVRHGQASWGAEDYDRLSSLGERQAEATGAWLAKAGVRPTRLVGGGMRRHRQTATAMVAGAGWAPGLDVDDGWDEFDHVRLMEVHAERVDVPAAADRRALDRWFDDAVARWVAAGDDPSYPETFGAFTARVTAALGRVADGLGRGETAVVVTSGGPVAWVVASLVDGGVATWQRLNPVLLNASLTKLTVGSRGTTAVSFNEHAHLPPDLLTYR